MMAASRTSGASPPRARTLEYRQAMNDFHTMFPSLEKEVIECVLRSNNGHVDSTIDQLLQISKESPNSHNSRRLYHTYDDSTDSSCSVSPELRDQTSSSEDDHLPPRYTPRHEPPPPHVYSFSRQPVEVPVNEKTHGRRKTYKDWNPPLLGTLPPDFLRLTPANPSMARIHEKRRSSSGISNRPGPRRSLREPGPRPHSSNGNNSGRQLQRRRTTGQLNIVVEEQPSDRHRASHQRMVMVDTAQDGRSQRPHHSSSSESRRHRRSPSDHDQYIEDRRIALLLQNEEFMKELRRNDEFLKELNRGRNSSNSTTSVRREASPVNPRDKGFCRYTQVCSDPVSSQARITFASQGVKFAPIHVDPLAALPSDKSGPADSATEDDAFKESVRHMSKSARTTFNEIARKFSKRRNYKPIEHPIDPVFANCPEDDFYR